jgi:hypothetical protein
MPDALYLVHHEQQRQIQAAVYRNKWQRIVDRTGADCDETVPQQSFQSCSKDTELAESLIYRT